MWCCKTKDIGAGFTVKTLSTQAGELPLIPEWTLSYTGTPGSGSAVLPAYIVTEDLIEYHWLSDPESANLPAWGSGFAGLAVCGGEVRRRGGKGCELCALPGAGRPLTMAGMLSLRLADGVSASRNNARRRSTCPWMAVRIAEFTRCEQRWSGADQCQGCVCDPSSRI